MTTTLILYTIEEAAKRAEVHARTIIYHIRSGNIKTGRIGISHVITPEDLERFIQERKEGKYRPRPKTKESRSAENGGSLDPK